MDSPGKDTEVPGGSLYTLAPHAHLNQAFSLTAHCSSNHIMMAPTELMAVWCGAEGKFLCPFSRGSAATPSLAALQEWACKLSNTP